MNESYGVHWFRRDLRVAGNEALKHNWKVNEGRVLGVFCFDKAFLSRPDFSTNRFQFFLHSLVELRKELRELGSDLIVMDTGPQVSFPKLINDLNQVLGHYPKLVTYSRDYEPFARKRDQELDEFFKTLSVESVSFRDHLLIEPHELWKPGTENGRYQVYSPFARQWLRLFQEEEIQKRVKRQTSALEYLKRRRDQGVDKIFQFDSKLLTDAFADYGTTLDHYCQENQKGVTIEIPKAGSLAGLECLESFVDHLDQYADKRDIPSIKGTSRTSVFLKNGTLTVPLMIAFFQLQPYQKKASSRDSYFSELIWREFYYHILYHNPQVESAPFLPMYQDIQWENRQDYFEAWKNGMTGFPIVDAGMRELKTTGWMHNRVRMIVSSFLTKDLLINWQWGEKYFMEALLDGDLAPNNGGWQWAASTGCDPQPYFRIFNPWLQSKKFDPQGDYIKKFIPELKDMDPKKLHQPISHPRYPEPIVDHKEQRDKALAMYKAVRDQ